MPNRVREVLLVSSPYDSYVIAEDDRLTERIFSEYLDLNLRYAPRVTRVSSGREALQRIRDEHYDVVITMMRGGDMDNADLARNIKRTRPKLPVVLLAFNPLDILKLKPEDKEILNGTFLWLGDAKIILSIIKLVEDRANIDHDIRLGGVHVILLVEDSVRFYSSYLPIIYTELMKQTQRLISDGVNLSHRMMRMRARPKILLAKSFEEAWDLYQRYHKNLLALVTDREFSHKGVADPQAGLEFTKRVKEKDSDMPVLIQSSDERVEQRAHELGASFLNKKSPTLLQDLRKFLMDHIGFGEFIFFLPDGTRVGSAADLHGLLASLKDLPADSLAYHADRNHFSKWLMARTEFELAALLRPLRLDQFEDVEELRTYLVKTLEKFLHKKQTGVISDFSERSFTPETPFAKLGTGSLGGKGRGLAFLNTFLNRSDFIQKFPDVLIRVPETAVIATDVYDAFLEENSLHDIIRKAQDDEEVRKAFSEGSLPTEIRSDLRALIKKVKHPLAVRSSSLLEDSQSQPFAGLYSTYVLPNNQTLSGVRLGELCRAVQLVYASIFSKAARSFHEATPHLQDEEKMAVVIQRLIGRKHGKRFYPDVSGVAQSYNYYPIAPLESSDGAAYVALGLGMTVMEGYRSLRFSPKKPLHLHQFSGDLDMLKNSQKACIALDLKGARLKPGDPPDANLTTFDLAEAESDGTLEPVGSTYSAENDRIYDGISRKGARLISFAHLLKHRMFPLAEILQHLLEIGEEAIGGPVEFEFAVDLKEREFAVLQIRPMVAWTGGQSLKIDGHAPERILGESSKALGNGRIGGITDIVYVKPSAFDPAETREIAQEVGNLNDRIHKEGRSYILIGPGRWGTADPWLGIPVAWPQISAAKAIVEAQIEDFAVDPSFGTHFLHNVISLGIGYFTIGRNGGGDGIDWEWLDRQKGEETPHLRHVRLTKPLDIRIDGSKNRGVILKPE